MSGEISIRSIRNDTKFDRYAVILAGGDGTRLRDLTFAAAGDDRPKQFCSFMGNGSLLELTRRRVSRSITTENTFFSLTKKHERFYTPELGNVPDTLKVIQPDGRGTAPAILYSLMRIAKQDPNARVAFFPSDHYFADDKAFMERVEVAFGSLELNSSSVVLLGIQPDKPETSYGWIEPAETLFGHLAGSVSRVSRFWEKPTRGVAEHLYKSGCLWNSFVMIGHVQVFLDMFRRHLPDMFRMFDASSTLFGTRQESAVVRSIYTWIGVTNFSSEILEKCSDELLVMRVGDVGWCDLGEPQRVIGTLNTLGIQPQWLQSIAA
jgi:mannose-1-phosphate guanylyltransferase